MPLNHGGRHLREIFRKHQHEITPGTSIVTMTSALAARVSFAALEDDWLRVIRRASILAP
ncbi:MAG: hypothetical protein DLM52_00470 [Chthoniobacterales bacterium]|nr:MAG: hypothetical protein DLM52_00470 [Chthoniobacterales bacterium]